MRTSNLEDVAEHEVLGQGVNGYRNGNANTTENTGASTLPERQDALLSEDLATSIE
jgi:hypothetical protein